MGKIVKNGVTYSSSSDNADNVKYNNNVSNLDATNVQEAIDKLDESVDTLNSNLTQTEAKVNNVDERLTAENNMPFRFAFDTNSGKYGYITESGGADTFNPFNSFNKNAALVQEVKCDYPVNRGTLNKTLDESGLYCVVITSGNLVTYGVSAGTPKLNNVPLTAMVKMFSYCNGAAVYFFHADAGDVVYNYMSMSNPDAGFARTWLFKID